MVPEADTSEAVRRALVQLPARLEYAAYADGIPNGGDDLETGAVHYVREAAERLGDAMFDASRRAAIASAASVPHKPLDVSVEHVRGSFRVRWSAPLCRWSGFVVQYSIDGGGWTTVPREVPCALDEQIAGVPGAFAAVRVATVHGEVRSAFTTPVDVVMR